MLNSGYAGTLFYAYILFGQVRYEYKLPLNVTKEELHCFAPLGIKIFLLAPDGAFLRLWAIFS